MSCGTGECGCGCEDLSLLQIKTKEAEIHPQPELVTVEHLTECCEPVCSSTTCQ